MRFIYYFLTLIFLFSSCKEKLEYGQVKLNKITLTDVNVLEKNRMDFDNDTIKLKGNIHMYFEDVSVGNENSRVWIDNFEPAIDVMKAGRFVEKEVTIIGLFDAHNTGHFGFFNGALKEVYFIKAD